MSKERGRINTKSCTGYQQNKIPGNNSGLISVNLLTLKFYMNQVRITGNYPVCGLFPDYHNCPAHMLFENLHMPG